MAATPAKEVSRAKTTFFQYDPDGRHGAERSILAVSIGNVQLDLYWTT